jgi:hypothetical protein
LLVANASSSNRAFKIELAKAKRNCVEYRDVPNFEMTDIVPLVNKAFPKSFGKFKMQWKNILNKMPVNDVVDLADDGEETKVSTSPN